MIKIKIQQKPVRLKINGIPVQISHIIEGEKPTYSSSIDEAIVDFSVVEPDDEEE